MPQRLTTYSHLREQLKQAHLYDTSVIQQIRAGEPLQPQQAGKVLTNAYEQLRNAAELTSGNLTTQRAIKRFFKRTLFLTHHNTRDIGQELVTELLLGGYIQDGSLGENAAHLVSNLAAEHMDRFHHLRKSKVSQKQAMSWTLAVLSVQTYDLLLPHAYDMAICAYAYQYFLAELPGGQLSADNNEDGTYNDALYVAVLQALLQADIDVVRSEMLRVRNINLNDAHDYVRWNNYITDLYTATQTLRLKRVISRNGAPFRILRSQAATRTLEESLDNREMFLSAYQKQIAYDYGMVHQRLNRGVFKSIVFLFLTKVMIGLAVEVPYDRYRYGQVILMPLLINLLFPPMYMATIRLGLVVPSTTNAHVTTNFMDALLYGESAPAPKIPRSPSRRAPVRIGYSILFFIPFVVTYFILHALHFNLLQMAIFIIFFSTASFLGYRLSLLVREFRMAAGRVGTWSLLWDLFYLPYITLGQWLASRYAEINVVGEVLDLFIELPLKTVLSLVRQWVRFLSERHEELY